MTGAPPQFSLGKSFAASGPTGPALVSVDAFDDPDDIGLWCDVAGERMQDSRSGNSSSRSPRWSPTCRRFALSIQAT